MGRRPPGLALLGKAALTLGLVLLYYCFSIGITFYNKWLMKGPDALLHQEVPCGADLG